MQTIFFSGGFGAHRGRQLAKSELFAMHLAHAVYPEAKLLAYCDEQSWHNVPAFVERRPVHIVHIGNMHGSHFNDIFRLNKLLGLADAMYLDTDMFLLRRLPIAGEFAAIRLTARKAVGCLQYVAQEQSPVLLLHKQAYEQATPSQLKKWDYLAGVALMQAIQACPLAIALPGRPFSASNLLGKLYGPGVFSKAMRRDCYALHAYANPGKQWLCQDGKPGLNEAMPGTILYDFYQYASELHGLQEHAPLVIQ